MKPILSVNLCLVGALALAGCQGDEVSPTSSRPAFEIPAPPAEQTICVGQRVATRNSSPWTVRVVYEGRDSRVLAPGEWLDKRYADDGPMWVRVEHGSEVVRRQVLQDGDCYHRLRVVRNGQGRLALELLQ